MSFDAKKERSPSGILRLDSGRPRRLSADYRFPQQEPSSPQPTIDPLSVTFAEDAGEKAIKVFFPVFSDAMDRATTSQMEEGEIDDNESDQEDYSASINAIIQRRASTRRSKRKNRRSSSPFAADSGPNNDELRRRSSVFTTSSGETAITIEENVNNEATHDEICEMIKLHKEVLSNVKFQPWSMRKKLKLIRQARAYIKKHEGELQVRLAQSHSTKDMVARWKIYLAKKWQKWKSEIINYSLWLIPWELKIKEIESHFGSVVASYFIFLRWLFWVNIVIAVVLISFVTIPEIVTADPHGDQERKFVLEEEKYNATNFLTLWDFEGAFKYSPIFYGWYTHKDNNGSAILGDGKGKGNGYRLPFAYFVTGVLVYAYSFFAILRKMAENSRTSRLSEKDDECNFSVKLFTAWDFTIGNAETAHNRVASIVMGFKEALLEEVEKKREPKNWKIICLRILVNILVIGMLSCSAWVVIFVVKRSNEPEAQSTLWRRNESTLVITLISNTFPFLFEILGILEQYHPRKTLQVQLARIMVLNLLNLYSLVFSTLSKISEMSQLYYLIEETNSTGGLLTTNSSNVLSSCPCTKGVIDSSKSNDLFSENLIIYPNISTELVVATGNTILENFTEIITNNLSNFTKNAIESLGENVTFSQTYLWENSSFSDINFTTEIILTTNINTEFTEQLTTNLDTIIENYTEDVSDMIFFTENISEYVTENYRQNVTQVYNIWNSTDNENETQIYDNFTNLNNDDTDLSNSFSDYLSYILGPFSIFWNSNSNESFQQNYTTVNYENNFADHFYTTTESSSSADVNTDYITTLGTTDNIFTDLISSQSSELFSSTTEIAQTLSESFTTEYKEPFGTTLVSNNINHLITTTITHESITNTVNTSLDSNTTVNVSTAIIKYTTTTENPTCRCSNPVTENSIFILQNRTIPLTVRKQLEEYWKTPVYERKTKIRSLCWETMFGQELIKLTVMDLLGTIGVAFGLDFFRGIFVRVMNNCWCWDLEKKFPQYGDFKVAENILHLVNNQGMVWMGMFFSPGLVALNVVKLYIMMYFRSWVVLTCNVPPTVIFRASRSNNFYYALLLMMLFLCVLPVSYAIVWVEPSQHCGPFSRHQKIFHIFTKTLRAQIPPAFHWVLEYIASPGIVIPLLLLLVLIIYYLMSLTSALKEANDDLKIQLKQERTEERRKMFKLAAKRKRTAVFGESHDLSANAPFARWKKLLGDLPSGKSHEGTPKQISEEVHEEHNKVPENKSKVFFSKLIKKALGKPSTSDEDQDNTDNEQHESLPYDVNKPTHIPVSRNISNGSFDLQSFVHKAISLRKKDKIEEKTKESLNLEDEKASVVSSTKGNTNTKIDMDNDKINSVDSDASSLWSEKIPVITISKTESDEYMLKKIKDGGNHKTEEENQKGKEKNAKAISVETTDKSFKPKIKCALTKQSTEIDEDIIIHFSDNLENIRRENEIIEIFAHQKTKEDIGLSEKQDLSREEIFLSEKSSSDGTEDKGESSIQTILNVSTDSSEESLENKS